MNNIKTLYIYLMKEHQAKRLMWYNEYKEIIEAVQKIKDNLSADPALQLDEESVYSGTIFSDFNAFFDRMFRNNGNGIASNGRSILSNENSVTVKTDSDFKNKLKNLIVACSRETLNELAEKWRQLTGWNNPVLTNRAAAACNLNLSSTVDVPKFNTIFSWFINKGYIKKYEGENNWYDKNIFLGKELRNLLNDIHTDPQFGSLQYDDYWVNIFIWLAYENLSNPFSLSKQMIKYGAPGTGKTFKAVEQCGTRFTIWKHSFGENSDLNFENVCETVQFHPTYSYEDFIEGLRPVLDDNGKSQLQLQNGVFKQFCKNSSKWELDLFKNGLHNDYEKLTIGDLPNELRNEPHWKIVEGHDKSVLISDVIPPHFFVIDEINRAELSRVFGELMYCLEYRGAKNAVRTQYATLNTHETGMIKVGDSFKFFVPHNLYLVGTMNTIDRSVDSFDFALRRRFKWEEVEPDSALLRYHLSELNNAWENLAKSMDTLNSFIEEQPILGRDFRIGHAYFWNLPYDKSQSLKDIKELLWEDKIKSLLEEYLRGTGKESLLKNMRDEFMK